MIELAKEFRVRLPDWIEDALEVFRAYRKAVDSNGLVVHNARGGTE